MTVAMVSITQQRSSNVTSQGRHQPEIISTRIKEAFSTRIKSTSHVLPSVRLLLKTASVVTESKATGLIRQTIEKHAMTETKSVGMDARLIAKLSSRAMNVLFGANLV